MAEETKSGRITTYRSEHDALLALERALFTIVRNEFGSSDKLLSFVEKRIHAAREVLSRRRSSRVSADEVRERIPSTKAIEKGEPRSVKFRSLDGSVVEVSLGVPEEEAFHTTHVSKFRMKCTCWDAIRTSSVADKRLEHLLREHGIQPREPTPVFARYVLCKHTLASLARYIFEGAADVDDLQLLDTLRLSLFAAYLREEKEPDPNVVITMLQRVLGRI